MHKNRKERPVEGVVDGKISQIRLIMNPTIGSGPRLAAWRELKKQELLRCELVVVRGKAIDSQVREEAGEMLELKEAGDNIVHLSTLVRVAV